MRLICEEKKMPRTQAPADQPDKAARRDFEYQRNGVRERMMIRESAVPG
jgi:hypothetical protein